MKKTALISLILIFALFAAGCAAKDDTETPAETAPAASYTLTQQSYTEQDNVYIVSFAYPVFNETGYEKANALIADFVGNCVQSAKSEVPEGEKQIVYVTYNIGYTDDEILSIVFTGNLTNTYDRELYTKLHYSLNINIESQEKVKLTDLYTISNSFTTAVNNQLVLSKDGTAEYYEAIDLTSALTASDTDITGVHFYLDDDDAIGICLPVSHELGDYKTAFLRVSELENFAKQQ